MERRAWLKSERAKRKSGRLSRGLPRSELRKKRVSSRSTELEETIGSLLSSTLSRRPRRAKAQARSTVITSTTMVET